MFFLNNLSITKKIALITVVSILSFIVLISVLAVNVNSNRIGLDTLQTRLYPTLQAAQQNRVAINQIAEGMETAVIVGEEEMLEGADALKQEVQQRLGMIKEMLARSEQNEIDAINSALNNYYSDAYQLVIVMIDGEVDMATLSSKAADSASRLDKLKSLLLTFEGKSQTNVDDAVKLANERNEALLVFAIGLGLITGLIILITGFTIGSHISKGIKDVSASLAEMAEGDGDLTVRLQHEGKDELGGLVDNFNEFVSKLHGLLKQTVDSARQLSDMSGELSHVIAVANDNTSSQTLAINNTTGALQELFVSVEHIADHASRASSAAQGAQTDANNGKELMGRSVDSITELASEMENTVGVITRLEEHTSNVGNILATIRGIAEQTNLLALNAAIEAARAGEQGRGFAVVADEVRSLASRTQDSTQEIQQVLEELQSASRLAVDSMERGNQMASSNVGQAEETGSSLNSITGQVEDISNINQQIADATKQQNQTSELIQQYVDDIQAKAQGAIESTAELEGVSTSLLGVNQQLSDVVAQFKV